MRAVEFLTESVQEVTLDDLYQDNYPDQDELIWNFVGKNDFNIPFTVSKINPIDLDELICDNYGVDDVQDLFKKMQPEQERIISDYQNDPTLSQKIIVLSGRRIIDGNHRALAAVLANKSIKYIDISEEQQDLDEVKIDNKKGQGATPDNQDIDYLGLRVKMKPSTFLKLAAKINDYKDDYTEKHIGQGGTIAAPSLKISIPDGWTIGDFRQPARVSNHDGRHRMAAVLKLEGDKPVETHIFPRYHRHKHMTREFIKNLNKTLINQDGNEISGPFFKL